MTVASPERLKRGVHHSGVSRVGTISLSCHMFASSIRALASGGALALGEIKLRDWWRIAVRELPTGLTLGLILGVVGFARIVAWQRVGFYDYGAHYLSVAFAVGLALVGIVGFGSLAGSMLPFILRRLGFDPASASAPFVATLVDVTGLVIYFSVAWLVLRGTLL